MPDALPPDRKLIRLRLRRAVLWRVALVYVAWLLWMTLRPNSRGAADLASVSAAAARHGLSPALVVNGIGNVIVFAPLGFLLAAALRGTWRRQLIGAILIAAALSAGIELTQSIVPGRVVSAGDWALNALGALLGGLVARGCSRS